MIITIVTLNVLFAAVAVGGILTLLSGAIAFGPREHGARGEPRWPLGAAVRARLQSVSGSGLTLMLTRNTGAIVETCRSPSRRKPA